MPIDLSDVINMLEDVSNIHVVDIHHEDRTADLAIKLGHALGFPKDQILLLSYATKIHDLGRVGIDNNVIAKAGKLTQSQKAAMQEHAKIGYNLLKRSNLPEEILLTVLYHHEHYDGSGYPDKLIGENIPLFARIVCIVDSWDAICSKRPYHEARTKDKALEEMNKCSQWFDPKFYAIFLNILRSEQ